MTTIDPDPQEEINSNNVLSFIAALILVLVAIIIISLFCSCQRMIDENEKIFYKASLEAIDLNCQEIQKEVEHGRKN